MAIQASWGGGPVCLFLQVLVNGFGSLTSACDGTYNETCTRCSVTSYEDVGRELRLLWLDESHCEEDDVGFDSFLFAVKLHDWTSTVWVRFPYYAFDLYCLDIALLVANELVGVQKPSTGTAFFV